MAVLSREIAFSTTAYEINAEEDLHARERRELFKRLTGTRKAVHLTYVTTYGLKANSHAGLVQSQVVLEDLFNVVK